MGMVCAQWCTCNNGAIWHHCSAIRLFIAHCSTHWVNNDAQPYTALGALILALN